jgi:hypothetical protein
MSAVTELLLKAHGDARNGRTNMKNMLDSIGMALLLAAVFGLLLLPVGAVVFDAILASRG